MLDPERIPLNKLKQAFDLNEQDVETLISALWPNEIFPYALWEMAYRPRWRDAAFNNSLYYKAREISSFPEFDPLEHEMPLLFINRDRIVSFFHELAAVIFVTDLREGFNRIINWTYEKNDNNFKDDIDYFFNGLSHIESEHNFRIHRPFTWGSIISEEVFNAVFNDKWIFIASRPFHSLSKIFIDSIALNKTAAIKYLLRCGYYLKCEVKGISTALVEYLKPTSAYTPADEPPVAPTISSIHETAPTGPSALPIPDYTPVEPPVSSIIVVPRDLWEGKTPPTIRDGMREKGYDDPVIAHVLFNWCQQTNKTRLGKWLGDNPRQDDSTHRRRTNELLKKAEAFTITPA